MNIIKKSLFIFIFFTFAFIQSQEIKPEQIVLASKSLGKTFQKISIFNEQQKEEMSADIPEGIKEYKILSLNGSSTQSMKSLATNSSMELDLPGPDGMITLELVEVNFKDENFKIYLMPSGEEIEFTGEIKHYRGVVKGVDKSIASVSVLNNEFSGIISVPNEEGNLVLGKIKNSSDHIIYRDNDSTASKNVSCLTNTDDFISNQTINSENKSAKSLSNNVVEQTSVADVVPTVFFDVDYDIVIDKGGADGARQYIEGIFNEVVTLYANDEISIGLAGINIWTSAPPFNDIDEYKDYRNENEFTGNLGHFLSYKGNSDGSGGGLAYGSGNTVLCDVNYNYARSQIFDFYENISEFSFSVFVIAHELGHNFGSPHTQNCSWNGNNTAIDSCGDIEGSCAAPGIPSEGGTIMSYCHIQDVGVNFSLGLGEQPAALIKNNINNAFCLQYQDFCADYAHNGNTDQGYRDGYLWYFGSTISGDYGDYVYQAGQYDEDSSIDYLNMGYCGEYLYDNPCAGVPFYDSNRYYTTGSRAMLDDYLYEWNGSNWIQQTQYPNGGYCNHPCYGLDYWYSTVSYSVGKQIIYSSNIWERTATGWTWIDWCGMEPIEGQRSSKGSSEDLKAPPEFIVYPNPVQDFMSIEMENVTLLKLEVLIYDMGGRNVDAIPLTNAPNGNINQSIDLSGLSMGIYFINVYTEEGAFVRKIIKI